MRHIISAGLSAMLLATGIALADGPVKSTGKWLETEAGKGTITKWQTSDLTYDNHRNCLWSIADQNGRAQLPGANAPIGPAKHVFQIDIPTDENARSVMSRPVPIHFDPKEFDAVKGVIPQVEWNLGLDFEGFVADPVSKNMFYACTEGTCPLLMKLEFDVARMLVRRVVRISRREGHDDEDDTDINSRWEGLAINKTGKRLFLAAQRQKSDNMPRLYTLMVSDFDKAPSLMADPHSEVKPIPLKEVRLPGAQISALQYAPNPSDSNHPGFLLALNRNPDEKIFIVDLAYLRYEPRVVNLDLYAPGAQDGAKFKTDGMSPEGLAIDYWYNRVWLINDPWAKKYAVPAGAHDNRFKDEIPMLFKFDLKKLIP